MMKKLIAILSLFLAFTSCQKVIDVDLNDANPQIVIEANYSAEDSTVRVRVTWTSSFFDSQASPIEENAVITIKDALGNPTTVPYAGNGDYILTGYAPQLNTTYTLRVDLNGTQYLAQCFLPQPVPLEPITYDSIPSFFGNEGGYVCYLNYYDPVDTVNYYQIILSRDSEVWDGLTQFFTQDDEFTDGNLVQRPLFGQEFFHTGDTIGMEFRAIDKPIYHYINESQSVAEASSGAPANPTTNWNNKALGYFSAYSSSRATAIIQ